MAFPTAYHADSDADDEYERSVMTSPILPTDDETSPTDSDPPSTEPTPTFGRTDTDRLSPGSSILEWTTGQCADYVSSLGLPQYREKFIENEIVGEALIALKHDELKEMAIVSVGHRLTILKGVYDVKVKQEIPIESDHYIPPSADASLHEQSASRDDVSRIIQSIKIRDDRFAQMENELRRVTDEYRKLRDELLPIFRMAKDRNAPLPYPILSPDLQHHEDMMSPGVSQLAPEKSGSSLSRKFSTKRLFLGSTPKSSSPTHVPASIPENKAMTDSSTLDPSAAALAASSHLTTSMNGDSGQPATSPSRANIPSPTSPNTYTSAPPPTLAQRSYREVATPSTARPNLYHNSEDTLPHSMYSTTSTLVDRDRDRDRSGPTPTPSSMSRGTRPQPREISTSTAMDNDPPSAPSSGRNDTPGVEIFKSFRVSMEDPCHKVLPAALKKYNIHADWRQYALYIVYGDQERCLGLEEKPLILFKQLDKEGLKPMFMLRKHAPPTEGHTSGLGGVGGGFVGGGGVGAADGGSIHGGREGGRGIQFPPGGVL